MKQLSTTHELTHNDPLIDGVLLISGYSLRAFRRRLVTAVACFAGTMALTLLFLAVSSPVYHSESRILVNANAIVSSLTQPGRIGGGPAEGAGATAGVAEMVKARATSLWLIDHIGLTDRWQSTRTPFGRVVDSAMVSLFGAPKETDLRESLVRIINKRVTVTTDAGLITIAVDWHDPDTAFAIATSLTERFLGEVRDGALGQLRDSVQALEHDLTQADADLAVARRGLMAAADNSNALRNRALKIKSPSEQPDLETVSRLERELVKKREALTRLEAAYEQRVNTAESALNALRSTLGPAHPDVIDAERNLALQKQVPDTLASMRNEEDRLASELTRMVPSVTAAGLLQTLAQVATVDPQLELARDSYRKASDRRATIADHLAAARVELATSTAGFGAHYVITQPPLNPRRPVKPAKVPILIAGTLGGAVLAFVLAVLSEVMAKRIQEPWQITRFVGLPVLGAVERRVVRRKR